MLAARFCIPRPPRVRCGGALWGLEIMVLVSLWAFCTEHRPQGTITLRHRRPVVGKVRLRRRRSVTEQFRPHKPHLAVRFSDAEIAPVPRTR